MDIKFAVPRSITNEQLAQTFAAYLLGSLMFHNDEGQHGPFKKEPPSDADWQLDSSNDYWLHIVGQEATIVCRYSAQTPIIKAAVALFNARISRRYRFRSE